MKTAYVTIKGIEVLADNETHLHMFSLNTAIEQQLNYILCPRINFHIVNIVSTIIALLVISPFKLFPASHNFLCDEYQKK